MHNHMSPCIESLIIKDRSTEQKVAWILNWYSIDYNDFGYHLISLTEQFAREINLKVTETSKDTRGLNVVFVEFLRDKKCDKADHLHDCYN